MRIKYFVINVIFCLSFFAILFLAGEIIIRLYLRKHIIYDIEMSRYSLLLKKDAKNPLIGHLHKPNTKADLMGTIIQINSDGFRDKEYPIRKEHKYRIIFLGDSLTLGWGVNQNDTFEHILERQMNKERPVEIINFGTGNYNTAQEVNLFIEKGLKYKPDGVVVFYFINDAEATPTKSKWWFLGHSRLITFYWSRIHAFINKLWYSKSFKHYYSNLYKDGQKGWVNAQKAFLQLKEICVKSHIALKVILLPELHNLNDYPFKEEHAKVSNFLYKNDISYLDLAPFFQHYKNSTELWLAKDDAHPNKKAHTLIAQYSIDFLLRQQKDRM